MKDTIDLKTIARILLDKIVWIIISAVVVGALSYAYTAFLVTPTYTSSAKMHVQGMSNVAPDEGSVSTGEVSIRLKIVPVYKEKLDSNDYREYLYDALWEDGVKIPASAGVKIHVSTNEDVTDVLYISVNTTDPELSYLICNKITEITPDVVAPMYVGYTLATLDSARVPTVPASPNIRTNTILGVLIGLVLSCGVIIVLHLLDNTIKESDRVTETTKLRFMGEIPDMNETFKGGYSYYKYSEHISGGRGGKR